jgi:hypothetical protein
VTTLVQRNGYKWWDAVVLLRRAGMAFIASTIASARAQITAGSCLLVVALFLHLHARPYSHPVFNTLEAVCLLVLCLSVALSQLLLSETGEVETSANTTADMTGLQWGVTVVTAMLNMALLAVMVGGYLWLKVAEVRDSVTARNMQRWFGCCIDTALVHKERAVVRYRSFTGQSVLPPPVPAAPTSPPEDHGAEVRAVDDGSDEESAPAAAPTTVEVGGDDGSGSPARRPRSVSDAESVSPSPTRRAVRRGSVSSAMYQAALAGQLGAAVHNPLWRSASAVESASDSDDGRSPARRIVAARSPPVVERHASRGPRDGVAVQVTGTHAGKAER